MKGLGAFLRKELRETRRTWRIWLLPAFILFSAVSSPILTYLTPTLIDRLGATEQGLNMTLPDPTAALAYSEYLGNLGQLVLFAMVIAYGGIVSAEIRSGTGALTLAKPLSRPAFVIAKWLSQSLVTVVAGALGTAVCIAITRAFFAGGAVAHVIAAVLLWFAFAVMLLAVMVLLSVVLRAPAAASGSGVGVFFAFVALAQFDIPSRVTPAGMPAAALALVSGEPSRWLGPLVATVVVTIACLAAAVWRFSRREI